MGLVGGDASQVNVMWPTTPLIRGVPATSAHGQRR